MLKKWIGVLTRQTGAAVYAALLFVAFIFGLDHWHQAWLNPEIENWYNLQSEIIKSIIFFTGCFVSYAIVWIVVTLIVAPINYALDPIYAKEREQKRRVKGLKIGDRVSVSNRDKRKIIGTVTRVNEKGETFDVRWDVNGETVTQGYFDVDNFERENKIETLAVR